METEIIPPSCCKIVKYNIKKIIYIILEEQIDKINRNKIVEIIFINENEMRKYNRTYRKINKTTNILTFNYSKFTDEEIVLSSIALCMTVIERRAKLHNCSIEVELKRTLIHGALHVAGYDHINKKERNRMQELENLYMNKFKKLNIL
ncbi:rRNA maturation RNase YbeY [candidate division WOR-3 bacterium]|jgi:probable rRNA maturation factor|nr:rRNA maturation RNase YbeY [candidate division WOR-3 bacterium]